MVDLYKALLLYHMKSVSSHYTNQGWVFIRTLINVNNWDGQLEGVKEAKSTAKDSSREYQNVKEQRRMRELVQTAQSTQEILGNFHQTIQDYITKQRSKYQNNNLSQCLSDLYIVGPHRQMVTIQGKKKDKLVPKAYNWILRTKEYQALADWSGESTCQVLWLHLPISTLAIFILRFWWLNFLSIRVYLAPSSVF